MRARIYSVYSGQIYSVYTGTWVDLYLQKIQWLTLSTYNPL